VKGQQPSAAVLVSCHSSSRAHVCSDMRTVYTAFVRTYMGTMRINWKLT